MWGSVYDGSTFVLDVYRRRLSERAGKPARQVSAELSAIDALLSVLGDLARRRAGKGTGAG